MRWDAEIYDTVKAPQVDAGREFIAEAGVREADTILDLGCGTGKLTLELARLASEGSVIGIDSSKEMLAQAEKNCGSAENISFKEISAQSMSFDNMFDLVFSNSALHWIKEQQAVLELVHRSLKDRGRIAFQLPARDFCGEFFSYIDEAIDLLGFREVYTDWKTPWYFPAREKYELLLKDTGFSKINVFYKDYGLIFKSVGDVLDWWVSAGLRPYLELLSEKEQECFKYAFAMSFEKNRTERGIEFSFRRLFAMAQK